MLCLTDRVGILSKSLQNAMLKNTTSANSINVIYPCPFSRDYGIPSAQAWRLLRVFLSYRLVLACLFIYLFYKHSGPTPLGAYGQRLFLDSCWTYLLLTVLSIIGVFWRVTGYAMQAQWLIFTDIIMLTLLMHACGGVNSGMGILLAVSIASGGLLIGGICSIVFAAIASLAVISEQVFADYNDSFVSISYTYAGMLGAAFFTIALLAHVLTQRSEQTLQLAKQQRQTILKLEELNRYIIQHLQSGILIIDKTQALQMANEAALRLLHTPILPTHLEAISTQLSDAFSTWLQDSEQDTMLLNLTDQSEIRSRFMVLPAGRDVFYLCILEDMSLYNQRLQQSKLASLGRLTASIAHEIRNPLGAISHAGQLLSENPQLSPQDQRLTEIIQTHSVRVNHIIDDILQLSRRTASRRETIVLQPWLEDYLAMFVVEKAIDANLFKLQMAATPLSAFVDPGHLKQILDNLCQNALKYGNQEAGPILLRMYLLQHAPCIEVIDNGPGVKKEHLVHLFEPFFTTSSSGTGLGLYISKELAELNQANLSYHLTPENQSCFRLCLPNAEQALIEI